MGDKVQAKRCAIAAGVAVVPGRTDLNMSDDDLVAAAAEIGYPVLVKPTAGGGGKGMRLVPEGTQMRDELNSARREAQASFGDDALFVERFVVNPRHIEVQILADEHGAIVHLGERECSLQRRYQKVVEETPSVLLDAKTRSLMGSAAVDIARSVGYVGVGTVEFIVSADSSDEFFFMEMNTRLQVEHTVTELVTGIDLVEQQLRVAGGEPLGFSQEDVQRRGHAIEARICAENPSLGFAPSGGHVLVLREPDNDNIRVDSSLVEGELIGSNYDPMLSKVIAWGPDRGAAIARLDRALAGTVILGVQTNTGFLRALLRHPDVMAGRLDTGLIDRELQDLTSATPSVYAYAAFALDRLLGLCPQSPTSDRWEVPDGWRFGGNPAPIAWDLIGPNGGPSTVAVTGSPNSALLRIDKNPLFNISAERLRDGLLVTIDGRTQRAILATEGTVTWVWLDGHIASIQELLPERPLGSDVQTEGDVRSPMPGTVITVYVKTGDEVGEGDSLVIVEAMKMEYTLVAPVAGTITEVFARAGDRVVVDARLVCIEPMGMPS
jgi:acetyl-CoA/propionyl-CoA carboxylase biotin carboxyl carrier protein